MIAGIDVPSDCYFSISRELKPYTLRNLSLTSKEMQRTLIANDLWREHFNKDFPDCYNNGKTFFEKYSIAKRSSHYCKEPLKQKLVMLIEANYPEVEQVDEEIKDLLPKFPEESDLLLAFAKPGMSFARLINEQNDPKLRTFFFKWVKKNLKQRFEKDFKDYWAITFNEHLYLFIKQLSKNPYPVKYVQQNRLIPLCSNSVYQKIYVPVIKHGTVESLSFWYQKLGKIEAVENLFALAVREGSPQIVRWLLASGELPLIFGELKVLLLDAICDEKIELIPLLIKNFPISSKTLENAILYAFANSSPIVLEVLLPYLSRTTINLNDQLYDAYSHENFPILKLLLAKGANIEHPLIQLKNNPTMLYQACKNSNETLVEFLLERGANPNFELGKITLLFQTECPTPLFEAVRNRQENIVKMLLARGAKVKGNVLEEAEDQIDNARNGRERETSNRIKDLLKS